MSAVDLVFFGFSGDLNRLIGSYLEGNNKEITRYASVNKYQRNLYGRCVATLRDYRGGPVPAGLIAAVGGLWAFAEIPDFDLTTCEKYKPDQRYIDFVQQKDLEHPVCKGKYGNKPFLIFVYKSPLPSTLFEDHNESRFDRYWTLEVVFARYSNGSQSFQQWTSSPECAGVSANVLLCSAPRATKEAQVLDRIHRLMTRQPLGEPIQVLTTEGPYAGFSTEWIENPIRVGPDYCSRVFIGEVDSDDEE